MTYLASLLTYLAPSALGFAVIGWLVAGVLSAGYANGKSRHSVPSCYETEEEAQAQLRFHLFFSLAFGPFALIAGAPVYGFRHFSLSANPIPDWYEQRLRNRGKLP